MDLLTAAILRLAIATSRTIVPNASEEEESSSRSPRECRWLHIHRDETAQENSQEGLQIFSESAAIIPPLLVDVVVPSVVGYQLHPIPYNTGALTMDKEFWDARGWCGGGKPETK